MNAEQQEIRRLIIMMRDPRYWRDKEPAFVATVSEGFKTLYRQRMLRGETPELNQAAGGRWQSSIRLDAIADRRSSSG